MDWNWLSMDKLMDPNTGAGAVALALGVIIVAWVVSIATTRLLQRPLWAVGRLIFRVPLSILHAHIRSPPSLPV